MQVEQVMSGEFDYPMENQGRPTRLRPEKQSTSRCFNFIHKVRRENALKTLCGLGGFALGAAWVERTPSQFAHHPQP